MDITVSNTTKISGLKKKEIDAIKEELTISNPLFARKKAMNLYLWDTPQHFKYYELPNKGVIEIPVGATQEILEMLKTDFGRIIDSSDINDTRVEFDDHEFFKGLEFEGKLRDYQEDAEKACLDKSIGVVQALTASGKCLGKGTPVLMHSGEVKNVEDVGVGDTLMGPDSEPRKVLSLARGREKMYRITPTKGESWECNESHILSLVWSGKGVKSKGLKNNGIIDISVKDFLQQNRTFQDRALLYRTGVDFPYKEPTVDPYLLGLWLGDGHSRGPRFTTADQEIIEYLEKFAEDNEYRLSKSADQENNKSHTYRLNDTGSVGRRRHRLTKKLEDLDLIKNKHIPDLYLHNSRQVRLNVLAGLIDSDGYLYDDQNYLTITSKYEHLADQVVYLSRSLGLAAYKKERVCTIKSTGFSGMYYRVGISGHIDEIPCKMLRKQGRPRKQIKNVCRTGFEVEDIGEGDYYGFEIDGDRRFLLGDFTVTHNTVIFSSLIASRKQPTLVLANKIDLANQLADAIAQFTNIDRSEIGYLGSGEFDIQPITVGIHQSLASYSDEQFEELNKSFSQIICDETHIIAADTFYENMRKLKAKYKFGFSSTPSREDGLTRVINFATGPIIHKVPEKKLTKYLTVPTYRQVKTNYHYFLPNTQDYQIMLNDMAEDEDRNDLILTDAMEHEDYYNCLLCARTSQVEYLADKLGDKAIGLTSKITKKKRKEMMKDIKKKKYQYVIATYGLMSTGIDVPFFERLLMCAPISSKTKIKQSVGRLMRRSEGKTSAEIVDFVDLNIGLLIHQAKKREKIITNLIKSLDG